MDPIHSDVDPDSESEHRLRKVAKPKKHSDKKKRNPSPGEEPVREGESRESHQLIVYRDLKHRDTAESKSQLKPDPNLFREVDVSDPPSQYTEDTETFRQVLNIPKFRDSVPVSSTSVWGLNKVAQKQEVRPKGLASFRLANISLMEALEEFELDFNAANLSDEKFIKAPPCHWQVLQIVDHCFEEKKCRS